MEQFPQPQQKIEKEKEITDAEIFDALEVLKTNPENLEAKITLQQWSEQEYSKVVNNPLAMIEFNLRTARLYLETGHGKESLGMFNGAMEQAWNEGNAELYQKILDETNEIQNWNN